MDSNLRTPGFGFDRDGSPCLGLAHGLAPLTMENPRRRVIKKGGVPMHQGDPSTYTFVIEAGGILLFRSNEDGDEVALEWVGPGGVCGLADAVREEPYSLSARTTTTSVVLCVPSKDLRLRISREPSLGMLVSRYLADQVRLAADHIEALALDRLDERVMWALRFLAHRYDGSHGPICVAMTQSDLAALVAASRPHVNQVIVRLRQLGIAESRWGYITILDLSRLRTLSPKDTRFKSPA